MAKNVELTAAQAKARLAAQADKQEKAEAKAAVKPPAIKQVNNPKNADPATCLKAYDALIDELAKTEAKQRIAKKPFRIFFIHRKRAEVMRQNLIKSMR